MTLYDKQVAVATTTPRFFDHLRALCRRHMRHLTDGEVRIATQLLSYADSEGFAFPGASRLATDAGLGVRHVRRTISRLIQRNLVQTVSRRTGRRGTALRRITMAQAAAEPSVQVEGSASENPGPVDTSKGGVLIPTTVTPGVTQTPSDLSQSTSDPRPCDQGDDGNDNKGPPTATDDDGNGASRGEADEILKILLASGVFPHVARSVTGTRDLRVAEIHVAVWDAKHAKKPPACLTAMLTRGTYRRGDDLVQPEVVAPLVNDGLLRKVAGMSVVGARARHNRNGLYLYRASQDGPFHVVPTKALTVKSLE